MERGYRPVEPGDALRALRRSLEVSQRHLAEMSGVDQSVVSRLERGLDGRWTTWKKVFEALGCEIELKTLPFCTDDVEDFIQDGIQARKDRMEAGRQSRW